MAQTERNIWHNSTETGGIVYSEMTGTFSSKQWHYLGDVRSLHKIFFYSHSKWYNFKMINITYYYLLIIVAIPLFICKKNQIFWIIFIASVVTLVSALRFNFGADYQAYAGIYKSFSSLTDSVVLYGNEILYYLYNTVFIKLGLSYSMFVAFNSLFLMTVIVSWILLSSNNRYYSLSVYISFFYLVWNLSTFRQALALTIGSFLLFNAKLKFHLIVKILLVPLLGLFHVSAWIYIVLLVLGYLPWKKYAHLILFASALMFTLLPVQELIGTIINHSFLDSFLNIYKVRYYFKNMEFSYNLFNALVAMRVFFFALVWSHYDVLAKDKYHKMLVDTFLTGMTLYILLSFNTLFSARLTIYAFFLIILLLPEIVMHYFNRGPIIKTLVLFAFVLLSSFMYFKDLYAIKSQLGIVDDKWYVKYETILDQEIVIDE